MDEQNNALVKAMLAAMVDLSAARWELEMGITDLLKGLGLTDAGATRLLEEADAEGLRVATRKRESKK